jgi:hypothetical protein
MKDEGWERDEGLGIGKVRLPSPVIGRGAGGEGVSILPGRTFVPPALHQH